MPECAELVRGTFDILKNAFALSLTPGSGPKQTIDVAAGANCGAFKPFGMWTTRPW